MIEGVDPSDTDTMDELDARVWCFINNEVYMENVTENDYGKKLTSHVRVKGEYKKNKICRYSRYTRSRDALKSIRPDGWWFICAMHEEGCTCECAVFYEDDEIRIIESPELPTEELAELHAIIQAIEYERKTNSE